MRRLLLDCDTGVDDAIAILYALTLPDVEVVGIGSVWGNVPLDVATRNTLRLVEIAGAPKVPVAGGAAGPLAGGAPVYAPHVHGDDGQGNVNLPPPSVEPVAGTAAEQIVRLVSGSPKEIDLVAVGPLTNLALALGLEPRLPELVRGVTIMGGASEVPGNVSVVAEANIWCDPEAAAAVFRAGWPLAMVPLDVTMRAVITDDHRARLHATGTPIATHVAAITDFYFEFFREASYGVRCSPVHDALAVGLAAGYLRLERGPLVRVEIDTGPGPGRGQTICDTRGRYRGDPDQPDGNCRVALRMPEGVVEEVVARLAVWPPDPSSTAGHALRPQPEAR